MRFTLERFFKMNDTINMHEVLTLCRNRCSCSRRQNAFLNNRVHLEGQKRGEKQQLFAQLGPLAAFISGQNIYAWRGEWAKKVVGEKRRLGYVPISLQHCAYAALHIIEMANSERQRF